MTSFALRAPFALRRARVLGRGLELGQSAESHIPRAFLIISDSPGAKRRVQTTCNHSQGNFNDRRDAHPIQVAIHLK